MENVNEEPKKEEQEQIEQNDGDQEAKEKEEENVEKEEKVDEAKELSLIHI